MIMRGPTNGRGPHFAPTLLPKRSMHSIYNRAGNQTQRQCVGEVHTINQNTFQTENVDPRGYPQLLTHGLLIGLVSRSSLCFGKVWESSQDLKGFRRVSKRLARFGRVWDDFRRASNGLGGFGRVSQGLGGFGGSGAFRGSGGESAGSMGGGGGSTDPALPRFDPFRFNVPAWDAARVLDRTGNIKL